jgi:hypothetical protein
MTLLMLPCPNSGGVQRLVMLDGGVCVTSRLEFLCSNCVDPNIKLLSVCVVSDLFKQKVGKEFYGD